MKNNFNKAYQKSLGRTNQGDGLDFWRTPPQATEALMERESFVGSILEPACGVGDMTKIISHYHPRENIYSSDIIDRGFSGQNATIDFLDFKRPMHGKKFDNVITNPPFNLATEFVLKGLEVAGSKMALLLKLEFLQSIKRYEMLFEETPLKKVLVFSYRVPFWQDGYDKPINNQRHIWCIWEHGYEGDIIMKGIKTPFEGVDRKWFKKSIP